ncbi:hypothetical protein O5D80_8733 [Batrachochytrium dendrobatidis]|nr:hypothetical protein O5D80_8733 [Batrachochytrium dendrobatidis]
MSFHHWFVTVESVHIDAYRIMFFDIIRVFNVNPRIIFIYLDVVVIVKQLWHFLTIYVIFFWHFYHEQDNTRTKDYWVHLQMTQYLVFLMKSGNTNGEPADISRSGVDKRTYSYMLSTLHFEFDVSVGQ